LQIVGYPENYLVGTNALSYLIKEKSLGTNALSYLIKEKSLGTNTLSYLTEEKKSYDICEWCTAGKRRQKQNISIVFLLTGPEV
jgi:hypothetical protein